ncbi:tetratricopeptide repeat protein [Streptomyces sp. R44]|uniref:Tetratricopeptide repeat protein n=1 Tax=Streptomyces sp. R44 TaxID=3238633 RepID=A0AB39T567_9ACTN
MTKLLAESGADLSREELLDALWLAEKLPRGAGPLARAVARSEASRRDGASAPRPPGTPDNPDPEPPSADPHRPPAAHPLLAAAAGDRSAGDGTVVLTPAHPVGVPDRHSLGPGRLQLEKSLRPLRQRFPDRRRHVLDVPRTVTAMAETGVPETVTRPLRTRWLTLAIVVDDDVSMVLWQRLAADVRALMERAGSFRDVRVHGLDTRGGTPTLRSSPYRHRTRPESVKSLCDPTGNTLVLVVSDGVGEAWRDGGMRRVMERWARSGPTAIMHALPTRLWASTGITARPWQVTTTGRGGPTRAWHVTDPDLPPELVRFDSVPVPVLEPTPAAVGDWARLVAAPGGTALLPLWDADRTDPRPAAAAPGRPDSVGVEAVLRFKEAASPEAYRLAAHVAAVAPVTPPVMRLVQAAVGAPTDPGHLTEVFLGGLMHEVDATAVPDRLPHLRRYDFDPEARRALLSAVPPKELLHTAESVTRRIESAIGRASVFPAWVGHPDGVAVVEDTGRSFGWIRTQVLTRLGIPPAAEDDPEVPGARNLDAPPTDTPVASQELPEPFSPEEVLAARERLLGPEHPETLAARADLGSFLRQAGRIVEAIALQERVVDECERVLGPDHPDTLTARAALGYSFYEMGRTDEAIALEEQVVVDRERVLGPDDPGTLTARSDLAFSYGRAGRTGEATALQERVVADRERVLGPEHPDTLDARSNLAFSLRQAGRLGEAIALEEQVISDSERLLGPEHPDTLDARSNLAFSFKQAGRTDEAIALQEHVLAVSERVLGTEHIDTLAARADLAFSFRQAGRIEEAIALDEQVVAVSERILGPEHPDTLDARSNLAFSYSQAGRTGHAILLQERVVADSVRALGADHPDTLTARAALAVSFREAGRIDEAIALQERVVDDCERVLGPDHPDTLTVRAALAYSLYEMGRIDEAIVLEEQVLAARERVLGPGHPVTLVARSNLAVTYRQAGRIDEAIVLQEQVLADRERVLGAEHPDTMTSRSNLAFCFRQAGRKIEAIALQERVLADRERVLGPKHPSTLSARVTLASFHGPTAPTGETPS